MSNVLRNIPSVNELLERPPLRRLVDRISHNVVVSQVRQFLDNLRGEVQSAASEIHVPAPGDLAERIAQWILREEQPALRAVINATGVLLHTGLGRAPLPRDAIQAIADICQGYASVEVDPETGHRSQRLRAVEGLLRQLTGAEAAVVVNNNAAATMLTLSALAAGREVVVSRGQLIEIGGSYRLPEVMTVSGARLREVGTTNKTRLADYQAAISRETAALMRVHTSNYIVVGFHEETALEELVALGRKRNIPVLDDIGSGAFLDFSPYGITGEPVASESIKAGADIVMCSGDKLLGGPQCGIILGRKTLLDQILRHPLMRALRVDKMTLAALAATLRLYQKPEVAQQSVPLLALLGISPANLQNRAQRIAPQMAAGSAIATAEAVSSEAFVGGGSVPTQQVPSWSVALTPARGSVDALAAQLRQGTPSVFGRVQRDRLLLDLRTVFPEQDMELVQAVEALDAHATSTAHSGEPVDPLPDAE